LTRQFRTDEPARGFPWVTSVAARMSYI